MSEFAELASVADIDQVFKNAKHLRVSERISLQIENAIFQRRLRAGDRLPGERELAAQFSASRVTVREALRAIQMKGLLEVRKGPAGGYFVRDAGSEILKEGLRTLALFGGSSVAQLAEVRNCVEPAVARLAAIRATKEDLDVIESALKQRASVREAGGDVAALDLQFHRLVACASKNFLHISLLDSLMTLERELVVSRVGFNAEDHEAVHTAHWEIFEAIAGGDGDRAEDAMRRHAHDMERRKVKERHESG